VGKIAELAKKLTFRYTSLGAPRYPYGIQPIQLATLIMEIERMKNVDGSILEIGVARGMTTRFICQHLVKSERTNERIYAIDTFESFNEKDVRYEIEHRGKNGKDLDYFRYNDLRAWKRNFRGFPFVTAIKTDCAEFDYYSVAPVKLALLDVDLYLPTKKALNKIFSALCQGGVILVDDVSLSGSCFDGANEAYREFCAEHSMAYEFIGQKCGVVRKT
jgi:O-methyltransferase